MRPSWVLRFAERLRRIRRVVWEEMYSGWGGGGPSVREEDLWFRFAGSEMGAKTMRLFPWTESS